MIDGPTGNAEVQTVLGSLAAGDIGVTLIHEHLMLNIRCYWTPGDDPEGAFLPVDMGIMGRVRRNPFAFRDNLILDDPGLAVDELTRFRRADGSTIVDLTPPGIGRDPRTLVWLAETTGLNIVAGCGYYIKETHPPGLDARSVDDIAEEMVSELTEGIGGTGVRAGVIGEIGPGTSPMDTTELRVAQAAALAQQEVKCAVVTHSAPGQDSPFEVAAALEKAGADMTRVVQSHLDERFRADIASFKSLAETGSNFGLDTFGRELYFEPRKKQHPTDETRVDTVCALLDAGLIDHLLLAHDICFKHELAAYGGHGYDHIQRGIVPRLKDRGVSSKELDTMLRVNPARVLTGAVPKSG